ncbi:cell division protein FtsQ [Paenibacillus sp. NPDC058367]|uniref:cell division protein FtsQ n=1 Tax=Paenibacillus sp. NPDC058367 TaxID=3346460 RepID=UPI003662D2F8
MSTIKTRYTLTQSQKMMIFVLSMSLYGLSNMFTELVPGIKLGPIELSIEYFAFIPLTLCMLFHPLYAAIGAAVGEVIFGELMLGQFGGLGELEKFITFSLAMYTAGRMVSDPKNRRQVGVAAITGVAIHQFFSSVVDIVKVWVGVEELEAVKGLAESIVVIEGVGFLNDVLFSGILFALIPTMYLVPRLYGKIEPLLGMKPRERNMKYATGAWLSPKLVIFGTIMVMVALGSELLSESGWNFGDFEFAWAESNEESLIWLSMLVAAIVAATAIISLILRSARKRQEAGQVDA